MHRRGLLKRCKRRAGLDDCSARERVDLLDPVHGAEVADHLAGCSRRPARKPGAPALGNDAQAIRRAEPHQRHDAFDIARSHQRRGAEIAGVEAGIAGSKFGGVPYGCVGDGGVEGGDERHGRSGEWKEGRHPSG